ncbi:MAG TPA: hypothetical protein VK181_02620 [Rhizobium sp.]|nr:hypothetical protein [Rhizobium sp.]
MFTSVDKALAALLAAIVYLLQVWLKIDLSWLLQVLTPETIATLIPIVTPVLVWAIPNKKPA